MADNLAMVLLGGGRISPNIAGVLSLRPRVVYYLISEDQPHTYDNMRQVLDRIDWVKSDTPMISVPAHNIPAIKKACRSILEQDQRSPFVFNITCATKTMAVAAYEVAKDLGHRVIYVDSFRNRIVDWTSPEREEELIGIDLVTYLSNFGRTPQPKFKFERLSISRDNAVEAARYLAQAGTEAIKLLLLLRQTGWRKKQPRRHLRQSLSAEQGAILSRLSAFGLIENLEMTHRGFVAYTISNPMHWNFIKGDWLEVFVFSEAQECFKRDDTPLFDDLALSLEMPTDQTVREIDFAGLYGWQLIWCSCKATNDPYNTDHLDEISAMTNMIGGRYCTPIYVTTGSKYDNKYPIFKQRAHEARIVVVTREELSGIREILQIEATKPTYPRI